MVDSPTVMRRLDILSDLMGPPVGVLLLMVGVQTYRDGGSIGWPIAGSALLLVNLYVAGRRFARHRKRTSASTSSTSASSSS
ncbi:hypothetical protein [Streptomyces prunicolor]|uniref:Integral membrane protein n=1 Tax=Streptomyces prunicolor TaxID=67348 RepID=A0ABU4FQM2_9ACTN|nr:hypothetical protein [Streptomyces prunicolor]MDV7222911.1 hypothetical protein [Streptomyces prunicolor]